MTNHVLGAQAAQAGGSPLRLHRLPGPGFGDGRDCHGSAVPPGSVGRNRRDIRLRRLWDERHDGSFQHHGNPVWSGASRNMAYVI